MGARRAGHGVAVLLKIYVHYYIDGQADAASQRITDALGGGDDGDGGVVVEQAS